MPNDKTTPVEQKTDTTSHTGDWEQRYIGLQKVVEKRDAELAKRQAALDALKAEHEAATSQLNEYRQKDVDTSEEAAALAQYEQLRERFESPPPVPVSNAAPREWFDSRRQDSPKVEIDADKTNLGYQN